MSIKPRQLAMPLVWLLVLSACPPGQQLIAVTQPDRGQAADAGGADAEASDGSSADLRGTDRASLDTGAADAPGRDVTATDGMRTDAAAADATAADATTADTAAADAATADVAAVDVAVVDAARADVVAADLGRLDARAADGGSLDTSSTDVARVDAAAVDGAIGDATTADGATFDAGVVTCPAATLGARLGHNQLLIGGSMDDSSFAAAPFDLGYRYVAETVPAGGPCASCAQNCTVDGQSCVGGACVWWGCWQWDQLPPGRYVADYLASTASAGAVPMITQYIWYYVAGHVEGAPEIAKLQDGALLASYLADYRFLCQVMGEDPDIAAILHIEPDLWGYGHQINADPTQIPVALGAAAAPECSAQGDHLAGLARCMLAIARSEAPNVLVGFHASAWGAGADALVNSNASFDLADHAARTAAYMRALGADQADLVVVEMSDRDAAFSNRWWDASDGTLPSFSQAIAWVEALGDGLGLPTLWWQVPYGNLALDNSCDHYQDNRVDYVFDHPQRFARGKTLGIAFGAGAGCQTTPASDDGHFVSRAQSYYGGARPPLCGE